MYILWGEINMIKGLKCLNFDRNIPHFVFHFYREFGVKCSACTQHIHSTDWVRRAKNYVFHLACFACDSCKRQLSTGEEFAMVDHRVVCKTHYTEMVHGESTNKEGRELTILVLFIIHSFINGIILVRRFVQNL